MGIRLKILLAFILCFGAMAGISLKFLQRSVNESYGTIEQAEVEANVERVEQSFEASAVSLRNQTRDWAVWNEMYRYALNPDPDWVVENIGDDALAPADISMVMIFDLQGRLLNFSAAKRNGVDLKVLTPQVTPYLDRIRSDANETKCGILRIDAGLMLACWSGILPSDSSGSPVGTVLMGRLLDAERLAAMRTQTRLPFVLDVQKQLPSGLTRWDRPLEPGLIGNGQFWASSESDVYHLYWPVKDILKQEVGLISLDMPRSAYQQGQSLYQQVRRQLGWTALSLTIVLGLTLHFILIRRLRRFARQIELLEEHSTWKNRVDIGGGDELGLVAGKFNELLGIVRAQLDGLHELVSVKEDALRTIETTQKQLIESEKLAQLRQQRVSNLLDNSGDGFLSFGGDRVIDPEVSRACRTMLGCEPAGREADSVLFGDDSASAELLREVVPAVQSETDADIRASMLSLLPAEIRRGELLLSVDYKLLEDGRLMVVLADITEARRLETLLQRERARLELIVMAVSDTRNFFAAVDAYREFVAQRLPRLLLAESSPEALARTLYREIHTFKGLLSQFGFIDAPVMLHALETRLTGSVHMTQAEIATAFSAQGLSAPFEADLAILSEVLGADFLAHGERFFLSGEQAEQLEKLATDLVQGQPVDRSSSTVQRLLADLLTLRKLTLNEVLAGFSGLVARAARRVDKDVAPLDVRGGEDLWLDPAPCKAFFRALGHVFRNAVVHGIESPEVRRIVGKPESGSVRCRVEGHSGRIRLSIADDGAGLDLESLRERAVSVGLYSAASAEQLSEAELARLIFRDRLSVHEHASALSGRGVGLAAVLAETEALGGQVSVSSVAGQGTEFVFDLPQPHCAASAILFAWRHPPGKVAEQIMQAILNHARRYFEAECQIKVVDTCFGGGRPDALSLLDLTAVIGLGGGIRVRVAFSFETALVDAVYSHMTRGFYERPEDVAGHREAAIGELLNTVLGNATTDLQHLHRRGISMTTPLIVGGGQTILTENDDVFYTRGLRSPSGRLAIILIGPDALFGTSGF